MVFLSKRAMIVRGRVAIVVGFGVFGLLGLTTDLFRSPRSVVLDSLRTAATPWSAETRIIVDVRADPKRVESNAHHLQLRVGPGPWLRGLEAFPRFRFPFTLVLERRGVTLRVKGVTAARDGASYVRIAEMPAYGELGNALEGRWLQLTDRRSPAVGSAADRLPGFLRQVLAPTVVRQVRRGGTTTIRGFRTRSYRLHVDGDELRAVLKNFSEQVPGHGGASSAAKIAERALERYRIAEAELWVRPRSHTLVRARLELTPKETDAAIRTIILDATLLPLSSPTDVAVPEGAVRLRPETLRRLVPVF